MHYRLRVLWCAILLGIGTNAQGDVPQCVVSCMSSASNAAGCSGSADWHCMCAQPSFRSAADRCFVQTCSNDQAQIGENMVDIQCSGVITTSIPAPFSPPITTLSVTNSETSPPQQSSAPPGGPPRTSITLAPPIPPSSTVTIGSPSTQTETVPGPTGTAPTQAPGTGGGTSGTLAPNPSSSPVTGTGTATGNATTTASNVTTSGSFTPASATLPNGTSPQIPTNTGNAALNLNPQGEKLLGAILSLLGAWTLF